MLCTGKSSGRKWNNSIHSKKENNSYRSRIIHYTLSNKCMHIGTSVLIRAHPFQRHSYVSLHEMTSWPVLMKWLVNDHSQSQINWPADWCIEIQHTYLPTYYLPQAEVKTVCQCRHVSPRTQTHGGVFSPSEVNINRLYQLKKYRSFLRRKKSNESEIRSKEGKKKKRSQNPWIPKEDVLLGTYPLEIIFFLKLTSFHCRALIEKSNCNNDNEQYFPLGRIFIFYANYYFIFVLFFFNDKNKINYKYYKIL